MEGGKLKHNCVACRKARTKCDRTAPTCRRCKRLGLACVSVAVKIGRPTTQSREKSKLLYDKAVQIALESKNDKGPAKIIKDSILHEVDLVGSIVKKDGPVYQAIKAFVTYWVWTAVRRETVFLMSEALSLASTFRIPFEYVSKIMTKIKEPTLTSEPWVYYGMISENTFKTRIPNTTLESCYGGIKLVRCTYFGRSLFLVSDKMNKYMTEELANEMWRNNTGDVFAKIMTSPSLERLLKPFGKMIFKNDTTKYTFDKLKGDIEAYVLVRTFRNMELIDVKGNTTNRNTIIVQFLLSTCGEYYQVHLTISNDNNNNNNNHNNNSEGDGSSSSSGKDTNNTAKITTSIKTSSNNDVVTTTTTAANTNSNHDNNKIEMKSIKTEHKSVKRSIESSNDNILTPIKKKKIELPQQKQSEVDSPNIFSNNNEEDEKYNYLDINSVNNFDKHLFPEMIIEDFDFDTDFNFT